MSQFHVGSIKLTQDKNKGSSIIVAKEVSTRGSALSVELTFSEISKSTPICIKVLRIKPIVSGWYTKCTGVVAIFSNQQTQCVMR